MPTPLRLVFMGSAGFSLPILGALLDAGHDVVSVYCQPPRPAGRGRKLRPSPVHRLAEERGLAVRTPESLKSGAEHDAFAALGAAAAVVAAYALMLPRPVLEAPRLGCLNVHASLLPRWRGAAPIQRAILAGDGETGVTIMQMDEGLDTGAILLADRTPITAETTASALHDTLATMGARLMVEALEGLATGALEATPQASEGATYAAKLGPEEGRLDWRRPAVELERLVRGLNPWPGVWFEHGGGRIKVLAAEVVQRRADAEPGTVLDRRFTVACGVGALRLAHVQREGKTAMDGAAFLRGYSLPAGAMVS